MGLGSGAVVTPLSWQCYRSRGPGSHGTGGGRWWQGWSAPSQSPLRLWKQPPLSQVIENCPVTGIHVRTDDFGVRRVAAVETEHGSIQTPCVVNCAGGQGLQLSVATLAPPPAWPVSGRRPGCDVQDVLGGQRVGRGALWPPGCQPRLEQQS